MNATDTEFFTAAILRAARARIGADYLTVVFDLEAAFGLQETALDGVADRLLTSGQIEIAADGCAIAGVR